MSKRIVIVICIVIALVSFLGGAAYQYKTDEDTIQEQVDKYESLYNDIYAIPVDTDVVYGWLNWVTYYHQYCIEHGVFKKFAEKETLEYHQAYNEMYNKIRMMFLEISRKYE